MAALDRIGVLLCHENPVLQAGLVATLAPHSDLACAEGSGSMAIHGFGAKPDVIVADHLGGVRAASTGAAVPGAIRPRVLIVTRSERECDIRAALSGGVQGYLLLEDLKEHLLPAVRALRLGDRYLSPRVASRLAENVALEHLTQREEAVLGLVVEGLCNKRVANSLGITVGTVKSHLRSAFGKLGATSRTQAMAIAQRRGLLDIGAAAPRH
jgi:DNA-binding NarL/FixJ family response regulator